MNARPELSRLSLNQMTIDQCSLPEAIEACGRAGLTVIGPWRHKVAEIGVETAARQIREAGLRVSSLCRGGFFPAADAAAARAADDDNRRAVEEAATLGTDVLVLVCGPPIGRDVEGRGRRSWPASSGSSRTPRSTACGSRSSRCIR